MSDLSPAAQAVLDGAKRSNCFRGVDFMDESRWIAAAALEALADQVVPEFWHEDDDVYGETMQGIRQKILAIADELEKEDG